MRWGGEGTRQAHADGGEGEVGNSVGAVLPKEVLTRLNVTQGDTRYLTEAPDGYRLTPYEPEFAAQMEEAWRILTKRRNGLRELAKEWSRVGF
ncbi:AbrB/MazE/SpoVT family DNA-binding domain-containing protein [Ancylobacter sp. 6x-1]|uniref:AbrB/MazE/SpoVT family DNA-binding domain-containing protein n=1 Tax=Ancylobacter crimeensis TaxID=2579147 RepID=A0ABT0DG93_9HYPH|nr:AbrB/MazE/SpoVT family DNA-binding domain-containing protein [Ancylobacter crimeensis]MCK0198985.1 AbrB/MazE/SpoVT family DNA-binding domain-containing protein [Ancylobacter crimeensis]